MEDSLREQAWRDTLSSKEAIAVERLSSMPASMATAFIYIEFKRELEDFRRMHDEVVAQMKPGRYFRDAVTGVLGGLAALGATAAYLMGFTDRMR